MTLEVSQGHRKPLILNFVIKNHHFMTVIASLFNCEFSYYYAPPKGTFWNSAIRPSVCLSVCPMAQLPRL